MKRVLFILSLLATIDASAQFSIRSYMQELVEDAARDGLCLVTQEYAIQDTVTMKMYGRNGHSYFSRVYHLGVFAYDGILTDVKSITPWKDDADFKKYSSKGYQAVLGDAYLYGSSIDTTNCACGAIPYAGDALAYYPQESGKGYFNIDNSFGKKSGYAVVATVDKFDRDAKLSFTVTRLEKNFSADSLSYKGPAVPKNKNVVGGCYLNPVILSPGIVSFSLAGILIPKGDIFSIIPLQAPSGSRTADGEVQEITPLNTMVKKGHEELDNPDGLSEIDLTLQENTSE